MDEARREYELGSEHDSAGREAEAIPHYKRALALGLDDELTPQALLQLGNSLRNVARASAGREREALVDVLDLARTRIDADDVRRYARSLEAYTRELA